MSKRMTIEEAVAKLEAGSFSFRMVDAIKDHMSALEKERDVLRDLHADAVRELKARDYAIWRLERETTKLNAKIHAVIKANLLMENAHAKFLPLKAEGERRLASLLTAIRREATEFDVEKARAALTEAGAKLTAFYNAHAPSEEAMRRTRALVEEYVGSAKKLLKAALQKAETYRSQLK